MTLLELKMIESALPDGSAKALVQREIRKIELKSDTRKAAWDAWAPVLGLDKSDLDRVVTLRGTRYRIDGVNPGARKNAIAIVRVHDGKSFRCAPSFIRMAA